MTTSPSRLTSFIKTFGLPCIIGVAAIDPGNLEVDLQAGAALGYALIWSVLIASILGCILQTLAAHITIYTGLHLAEICSRVYHRNWILSRILFLITLLSVIAFDIAEVIGTAFATRMLFGLPLWLGMILSVCDTMLVLYLQRNGLTRIEFVIEGLLFILAACLVYEFVISKPSFSSIVKGALVPTFGDQGGKGVLLAISIMGSVIMSHNLFLHSWLEKERRKPDQQLPQPPSTNHRHVSQEEEQEQQRQQVSTAVAYPPSLFSRAGVPISEFIQACRYSAIESSAIFFSTFLINTCVLVVAATLPHSLIPSIDDFGLRNAGAVLQRALGQRFAATAWGVALLASGHAATVTGVLASQAICEGFLNIHDSRSSSRIVLVSRLIAIIPALVVALIAGESGSDGLAVASQAILSFSLPFAAIPLFKVLHAVGEVRQLYSRSLLIAGYVVFSVVMVANGFAIREFAKVVYKLGVIPLVLFVLFTISISAVLIKLLTTPIRVEDIDVSIDRQAQPPDEQSWLVQNK